MKERYLLVKHGNLHMDVASLSGEERKEWLTIMEDEAKERREAEQSQVSRMPSVPNLSMPRL